MARDMNFEWENVKNRNYSTIQEKNGEIDRSAISLHVDSLSKSRSFSFMISSLVFTDSACVWLCVCCACCGCGSIISSNLNAELEFEIENDDVIVCAVRVLCVVVGLAFVSAECVCARGVANENLNCLRGLVAIAVV